MNPSAPVLRTKAQDHELDSALDTFLIDMSLDVLDGEEKSVWIDHCHISNLDRSTGATLSHEISKRYGENGLPHDSININMKGYSGQSFGFSLAKGITLKLCGEANDGCGKSLSGGKIIVKPDIEVMKGGKLISDENVIVGNVALYGATSGHAYFNGVAGERFCVRNSGATAVVEGVGDHGCEYMTGGRVVVLGKTGHNFGAGMSGGVAYVQKNSKNEFQKKVNSEMVFLETLEEWYKEDEKELFELIQQHYNETNSTVAHRILNNWAHEKTCFIKVFPKEYKKVVEEKRVADHLAVSTLAAVASTNSISEGGVKQSHT